MSSKRVDGPFSSAKLRAEMARQRVTAGALAKKMKCSVTTIQNWKTGLCSPKWVDMPRLGKALKMDWKEFLIG